MNDPSINLLNFDRAGLSQFFADWGEAAFRATQVLKWVHQQGVTDFQQMTNLSKVLRQRLQNHADIVLPNIVTEQRSIDGTRKWLLEVDGNNSIEMVFIPEDDRGTLCISSQVGCALDCSFCATAQQGFNRNLSTAEIIAQIYLAEHRLRAEGLQRDTLSNRVVSNVVMMGMGEPLANFSNVITALHLMMDDFAYGLSWRRVTVSTSGIVPAIYRLKQQCPVSLAVSLHAVDDDLRNELVPINQKYPLRDLFAACRDYVATDHRQRITFEYVMLNGINDSLADAKQLVKLLRGLPAKVNLIPFNHFPNAGYQCSSSTAIEAFREQLMRANIITVTRKTRGDDIDAACGQLAGKVQDRSRRHLRHVPIHVEEVT